MGHHSTQVGQELLLDPKNGRQADPERVESTHKPTTQNDFNFQEQTVAIPTLPQTKYFQATLYWKGINSDHGRQPSETLNNEIWL